MKEQQIHLRLATSNLDLSKVTNDYYESYETYDRVGGFWTSTYRHDICCEWLHFKIYKPLAEVYNGYVFNVLSDAKIFTINSFDKEEIVQNEYKNNYNLIAKDFDGIHLDGEYLDQLKKRHADSLFLHWSCDSTWWFNTDKLKLGFTLNGEEIKNFAKISYKGFNLRPQ
ncbi:hypothetical protein NZ043_27345 [Paenibacillus sp. FSL k6-2145]|uniref:hypothetical protein n=1 Tax=Paenibacillus sp. FSL k6-2145 TaxID=2976834 RepID=UPI0030D94338